MNLRRTAKAPWMQVLSDTVEVGAVDAAESKFGNQTTLRQLLCYSAHL